ncbi:MAG: alpha/beta fold hydrolase [Actinomycetota bacterium]|nr:alpha/beta fold hydrolase [Actinomycetota bacterium]
MTPYSVTVDSTTISAVLHQGADRDSAKPLLVALHGGTYTSEYFNVAGSGAGSFVTIAVRNGFQVLAIDRPGYGASDQLPDAENTFARHAELLDGVIAHLLPRSGADSVVLVGHSIGGMIALEIAARVPSWRLIGVSATGMGARLSGSGAADQLAALPFTGLVDLPVPERDKVMFGPPGSYTDDAVQAAHRSYAPVPAVELSNAPAWPREHVAAVAAKVRVPVHNMVGEFDALWDSSAEARALFTGMFDGAIAVESELVPGAGHAIDHHLLGAAVHLEQLAFAHTCTWLASRENAAPAS